MSNAIEIEDDGEEKVTTDEAGLEMLGVYEGGTIQLPNWLVVNDVAYKTAELREMLGDEEDILTDPSMKNVAVQEVLKNCITKLGDVEDPKIIRQHVSKLSSGDASLLVVRLRQLSLGDDFTFAVKCVVDSCQHVDDKVKVQLSERGCSYRPADGEERTVFSATCKDGTPFTYKLLALGDQPKVSAARKESRSAFMSMVLYLRLVTYNGSKVASPRDLKKLTVRRRNELRTIMDENQYGIDMDVSHACSACGNESTLTLPISSEARFFFPSGIKG